MTVALRFRFSGAFSALSPADGALFLERSSNANPSVAATVKEIIERVRQEGDTALRQLARELDDVELSNLEVPRAALVAALDNLPRDLGQAMDRSARNIRKNHIEQLPSSSSIIIEPGITIGRRPDPLERVGVYAPGGRASYPSSVLMGVIPAKVAGVAEVILCSPPGTDGTPSQAVLAAAQLSGVDRVFAVGGAGAIAAMCLGTSSIPRVDKVVGPGNAFVAEAKLQLASSASFDSPAGPSELLVIADDNASATVVARELLAQAEHDPDAIAIVLATSAEAATRIESEILRMITTARRREIISRSLADRGGVLVVSSVGEAIALSNAFAPEHLLLAVSDPRKALEDVRNAGTVFLGESSSVAFGDYMTGGNHVLPTGGLARSYSGLSTLDFIRWTTYQEVTASAAAALSLDVAVFAEAEGLSSHAAASAGWNKAMS